MREKKGSARCEEGKFHQNFTNGHKNQKILVLLHFLFFFPSTTLVIGSKRANTVVAWELDPRDQV